MNILKQRSIAIVVFILTIFISNINNAKAQYCVHSVSSTSESIDGNGGRADIYLTTEECEGYTAYSNDSWLYVWIDYYEQTVSISADANHDGYREGTVVIDNYNSENDFYITITQEIGCEQLGAPGTISGPSSVCIGGSGNYSINPVNGATCYHWTLDGNSLAQYGTSVTISFGANYSTSTITACAYNDCGDGILSTKEVAVHTLPTPGISGAASACSSSAGNVYTTESGMSGYSWTVTGGSITSGGGTSNNSVTITWGSSGTGHVKVNYTNSYGCTASGQTDKPITIYALPSPSISGTTPVCSNSTGNVYTTESGMSGYSWTVIGGSITSGGGISNNSVTITWGSSGTGHVKVNYTNANGCTAAGQTDKPITINTLPSPTISGAASACSGSTGNVYTTESGMSGYSWTVTGGSITSGGGTSNNSVTITWGSSGTGHVKVNYTNANGCTASGQTDKQVTINALPSPTISGTTPVCSNSNGNVYTTESGMSGYSWTVTGGSITSGGGTSDNSVTITWGSSGTGHVKVNYTNGNGCTASGQTDKPVTINGLPSPTISGTTPVCSNSTGNVYTTESGMTAYSWTVTGGSITSGGGTSNNSVTITWGSSGTGHVKVNYTNANGCTASGQTDKPVTINALPSPTISGTTPVCSNSTGNVYTTESGMSGYSWTVTGGSITSGGGTSNNTVTITWGSSETGHVKVNYTNGNGCTAAGQTDKPVTINALPTPTISGAASVCSNSTGNVYTTESSMTGYSWTVTGGSITSGGGTSNNSATITWGSAGTGHVKVNYTNGNGCTAAGQTDKPITINTLPSPTISGTTPVCSNSTGNVYTTESGMTAYSWTVTGGSITAGGGTSNNTVTITWGSSGTGHVKVNYTNANGCTASGQTDKTVTINALPSPTVLGTTPVCSNSTGNVYTTESGMSGYSWSVTGGSITSGGGASNNSVTITWGSSGTGHVKVNYTNGNGCTAAGQTDDQIMINEIPSITVQPVDSTVLPDHDASFSVTASGTNLQYLWQSSETGSGTWTNLTQSQAVGYNTSTITIQNSVSSKYYRCQLTTGSCSIFSNSAKLTLNIPSIGYLEGSNIPNPETRQLNTSFPVRTLPGNITVSDFGAATYQIPLFTSPGSAGMKPEISVVYNSMAKDGLLGIGWDLSGLSTIQRVPQDIYHDTKVIGVSLQNTDKFALDSNRLVLTSGAYGESGSVYKTEIETFTRITAHGTAGTGPNWFEVETKDGKTIEYGNTVTSKVEAYGSSTVYQWRVNKITDQNGNYITFSYIENNGESYIDMIQYTGNGNISPYNTIKFTYGTKTDVNYKFVGGSRVPNTALLTSVKMLTGGSTLVREYQFRYTVDFYTHLTEIIEYGSDNSHPNSTVIAWGASKTAFDPQNSFSNSRKNIFYQGDFNGDGRTDFVVTERKTSYTSSDTWQLWLASADGVTFTQKNSGYLNSSFREFIVTDADGNGRSEIFRKEYTLDSVKTNPHLCGESIVQGDSTETSMRVDSSSFINSLTTTILNPSQDTCWDYNYHNNIKFLYYVYNEQTGLVRGDTGKDMIYNNCTGDLKLKTADLDGNGITDYIVMDQYNQLYNIRGVSYTGSNLYLADCRIIDFDGDKKNELLVKSGSSSVIYQYNPSTEDFTAIYTSTTTPSVSDKIFTGDFNGDGKTDILSWNNGWSLKFSTGTDFVNSSNVPALINTDPDASVSDNNIYVADINGDGKDDIIEVYLDGTGSRVKIFYSRGDGIFSVDDNTYSKSSILQDYISFGDFNGDGKKDLFYNDYSSASNAVNICFFRKDEMKHLITCIANGLNNKTWIYFSRLNKSTDFYTEGTGAQFPVIDYNGPFYVVDSTRVHDATGFGYLGTFYGYEGLNIHQQGKGFLGFRKLISTNSVRDSIFTWREYNYDPTYFFVYPSKSSVWFKNTNFKLSENENTYAAINFGDKVIFPYLSQILSSDYDKGVSTSSTFHYDNYGNMTSDSTKYMSGSSIESTVVVTNTFDHYGNWGIANKLVSSTSTSVYGSESPYSRSVSYTYDNAGKLLTEVTDPQKSKSVTKTYSDFDNFGMPSHITLSATNLSSRTTTLGYDSKSRFIITITNPLTHQISRTYDAGTGNLLTEIGIKNDTTSYEYDAFGSLLKTTTPQKNVINNDILWDENNTGGENSLFFARTTYSKSGKPDQYVYYDPSGRKLITKTDGFDGQILQNWNYSSAGSLNSMTYPYKSGDSVKYVKYYYDFYGRVRSEDNNGLNTLTSYYNNTVHVTNPAGQTKSSVLNSTGKVVQVTDNGTNINYSYNSNGEVKSVTTAGTTVSFGYDDYGRKTSVANPNSGTTSFVYNAFGELTSQTDAKNNTYSFQYDNLGRVETKTGPEGTTSYFYVTSGPGIEQVDSINRSGIAYTYTYDSLGQVLSLKEKIGTMNLTTNFLYDTWGNTKKIQYPSGVWVENVYNDDGYLTEIKKGSTTIWKLDSLNTLGQPLKYTQGPSQTLSTNFKYDNKAFLSSIKTGASEQSFSFNHNTGNLTSRSYQNIDTLLIENFTYDSRNRLKTYRSAFPVEYDDNGNITYKADAGTYEYDDGTKVNAVTGITGNSGSITDTLQTISYTAFNMTDSVSENHYSVKFVYGPDNQRVKSVLRDSGNVIKTKYYSPGYEKEITPTGTRELTYINSPYGLVAIVITKNGSDSTFYTETDHLGSIIGLLRETGSYKEQYSFDAWGRRRNPKDWSYDSIPAPTVIDRGFTGHEHLDLFGLINMNGRMYDPVVGRFLGVDPVIQFGDNSESFNGYSYCLNNPLRYSDPSGFSAYKDPWTDASWFHQSLAQQLAELYEGQWNDLPSSLSDTYGGAVYREKKDVQVVILKDIDGNYKPFLIPISASDVALNKCLGDQKDISPQDGYPIKDFGNIKGLDLNNFYIISGGVLISISYTSNDVNNKYRWIQSYSENGGKWNWDNKEYKNDKYYYSGSIAYYSPEELLDHLNGNTITFRDYPQDTKEDRDISFFTDLVDGNNKVIFIIYWGYHTNNSVVTPYYPRIIYP